VSEPRGASAGGARDAEEFGRNSLNVIVGRVLLTASVFGTSLITARWLGPTGRGEYSVAILVAAVVAIVFDLFSSSALYYSARTDFPRPRILGNTIVLAFLSGVASFLFCLALLPVHASLFGDVPPRYLLIAFAVLPPALVLSNLSGVMRGIGDFFGYNAALVAQWAVPLVLIAIVLIGLNGGPGAAIGAVTVGTLIVSLGAIARCRRLVGGIDWRPDLAYAKKAASFGIRAQPGSLLTFLGYRLDVLLVNGYLNAAAAGFYSVALATAERAQTVGDAASTVLYPRIAGEPVTERRARLTPIVARTVLWMTIVLAAVLFSVAHWLVVLLYSHRFEPAVKPTEILLLSMVPSSVQRVFSADIGGRGRPLLNSYVAAASVSLNVVLNVLWIPHYGISGAAWASVASYSLAAVLSCGVYTWLSGNSLASVVVPRREDLVLLRRVAASLVGSRRPEE
jgi:O-antigen/teichoic acid export membrane protein